MAVFADASIVHVQLAPGAIEGSIHRPEPSVREYRRCEQMHVDPSDAAAGQRMLFDEVKRLGVSDLGDRRQSAEQIENFAAMPEIATGDFADDERVTADLAGLQQLLQNGVTAAQVVHPH